MSHLNKKLSETSTSSFEPDDVQSYEKKAQSFAKQMLLGRIFIGTFQEKRYVVNLNAYRDVVSIMKDEHDLIKDLEVVRRRLQNYYSSSHWIGITTPDVIGAPAGHCVWVELDSEVFGRYWYKIKSVKFRENEVLLRIQILRSVDTVDTATKRQAENVSANPLTENLNLEFAKAYFFQQVTIFFTRVVTVQNIKESFIFLSLLVATIATGGIQLIKYLAEYFLKLLRETSNFIKTSTPIIIAIINLIGKTIGGLYFLIATMWRDRNVSRGVVYEPVYSQYGRKPMITYYNDIRRSPPQRSSVVITPLD